LNKVKAPYEKKAKILRSAKIPKALYGCEVAPVNETALRTLRTAVSRTLTFTTEHRSADLTFATASHGPDTDPEISIFARRAMAVRRFFNKSKANAEKVKQIMQEYSKRGEPGMHRDEEQLRGKVLAGDPATAERAEVRNQCKPKGPIGFLLESIHMQAATLNEDLTIQQWNQQGIELIKGPTQMVTPLVGRMAARNRTRRAEDRRFETVGLEEIDTFATNVKHADGVNEESDKLILRMMQTGSSWTQQLTKKTGREDHEACPLCGEVETKDHVWHCDRLKGKRHAIDKDLAEADPQEFTNAMRMGVACALNADPRKTYWGKRCDTEWSKDKRRRYGCIEPGALKDEVKEITRRIDQTEDAEWWTAREIMVALTRSADGEEEVVPYISRPVEEQAPERPNAYSDGSLKNTKGPFGTLEEPVCGG
jgi:hypothetical protein